MGCGRLVDKLPRIVNAMTEDAARKPRTIITDRGPGMYQSNGAITPAYAAALKKAGFIAFTGDDASWQPGDLADLFMHETVAGWVDRFFTKHPLKPSRSVADNTDFFFERMVACESHINANYDVDGLCRSLPRRVEELIQANGNRLRY